MDVWRQQRQVVGKTRPKILKRAPSRDVSRNRLRAQKWPGTERTRSGANAVQNLNGLALDGLDKRAQQVQIDAKEAVPDEGPRAGQDLDAWDAGDSKDAAARSLP